MLNQNSKALRTTLRFRHRRKVATHPFVIPRFSLVGVPLTHPNRIRTVKRYVLQHCSARVTAAVAQSDHLYQRSVSQRSVRGDRASVDPDTSPEVATVGTLFHKPLHQKSPTRSKWVRPLLFRCRCMWRDSGAISGDEVRGRCGIRREHVWAPWLELARGLPSPHCAARGPG